jgi:hypothetical protein
LNKLTIYKLKNYNNYNNYNRQDNQTGGQLPNNNFNNFYNKTHYGKFFFVLAFMFALQKITFTHFINKAIDIFCVLVKR